MKIDNSQDLPNIMRKYLEDELLAAATAATVTDLNNNGFCAENNSQDNNKTLTSPTVVTTELNTTIVNKILILFRTEITEIVSKVLKIPLERLDIHENMSRYGVDSIIVTEIMKCISSLLNFSIAPTVFFEARHLEELSDILFRRYQEKIKNKYKHIIQSEQFFLSAIKNNSTANTLAETDDVAQWIDNFHTISSRKQLIQQYTVKKTDYEPIAIIAMNGIFPESENLYVFEKHLRNGDNCIREIPEDRWNWRTVFGDPKVGKFTNVKYGGFAPDIDKFDPLFFGISPREAELMDPQHRLFIQCVWKLIEAAGYAPKSLSGRKIGMFIGMNLQDYAHMIDRAGVMEALYLTSLRHIFCPNRLSFYLNIHGPSQVIDTACSSSLVALHRAVMSIQHENCEMAIAGGANLIISPDMHIMYSKVGMICEDGRCKTFSKDANGYVRSDGVGAVLLKALHHAERDKNTILAVIRGSAENHGGMSTSLTTPNQKSQASLIIEAHQQAGIDPRKIGYIECHGTGTASGDLIEINGLKMAFTKLYSNAGLSIQNNASCGLGSVKSNIGHTETTAGIAGIIKVICSLQNRYLYRSLHSEIINPMIDLSQSPFYILQEGRPWQQPIIDGYKETRCACVSSFGAGGSNVHIVIEEYVTQTSLNLSINDKISHLILFSARNSIQLTEMVNQWLIFLEQDKKNLIRLEDIAYTLQVGREAMSERLALTVNSLKELYIILTQFNVQSNKKEIINCYQSNLEKNSEILKLLNKDPDLLTAIIDHYFSTGDIKKLAELWVQGINIDWNILYNKNLSIDKQPCRIELPTYPFARQRYWFDTNKNISENRHKIKKCENNYIN